jgi:hypothetical protein
MRIKSIEVYDSDETAAENAGEAEVSGEYKPQ